MSEHKSKAQWSLSIQNPCIRGEVVAMSSLDTYSFLPRANRSIEL